MTDLTVNRRAESDAMNAEQVREVLVQTGAIRSGHFQLTSGRHSDTYVQCARVLEHPSVTVQLARATVANIPPDVKVDLVVSPAVGGIVIGFAVALALDTRFIFAERQDGAMILRRAFEINPGEKVLVVEDVVTTGGSVKEVIDVVREAGGDVVGVVSLIDRGGDRKFSEPYWPLLTMDVASWEPTECALCAGGVELYSPGSRRLAKA